MPTELEDETVTAGVAPGCIDEVAQSIVKTLHDHQDGLSPEEDKSPVVHTKIKDDKADDKPPAHAKPSGDGKPTSDSPAISFPELLYQIVSDPDTDDVVSWLPHGRGFAIHDKNRFGDEILPRYFEGTKYTSFTRRLKRWSFTRIARGAELGAYYNECFTRDAPDMVLRMKYRVVHGDVIGAAAATMASGGTTHAAAAAALAAAAMLDGKKKRGKKGNKRKDADMEDGLMFPPNMMGAGFPSQPWNMNQPPFGNMNMNMPPMNMMQQQYFHMMMAQQFAAQQGAFNNFMSGQQGGNYPSMNMMEGSDNHQDSPANHANNVNNNTPSRQQFQGNFFGGNNTMNNMPYGFPPYPMMGMPPNMCMPTGNIPGNMMNMSPNGMQNGQQQLQGDVMMQQQQQDQPTSDEPLNDRPVKSENEPDE